jgi:DNA polymerase-3 subunit epsilon
MKAFIRCAIDFETACHNQASACAVGIARIREGQVAETFYTLIKPPKGMEILPFFTGIHGIHMEQVRDAPTFAEVWLRIQDFIGKDVLVAHNAGFDRGVLRASLSHYGISAIIPEFECTVELSRSAWPRLRDHKLDTVCEHLGIDLVHHEALSDAVACARIYLEAVKCTNN